MSAILMAEKCQYQLAANKLMGPRNVKMKWLKIIEMAIMAAMWLWKANGINGVMYQYENISNINGI